MRLTASPMASTAVMESNSNPMFLPPVPRIWMVKGRPMPSSMLKRGPPKAALNPIRGLPRLAIATSAIMSPVQCFGKIDFFRLVTYGVSPGQYREAKNGIGQAKHHSKGLEEADQLVGDGVDPDDGDDEAGEGEGSVVGGRGGAGGEGNDECQ